MKKSGLMRVVTSVVILLLVAIVSVAGVNGYRKLAGLQKSVDTRWAEVDKEYQLRIRPKPGLLQALSAKAGFNQAILTELAQAREKVDALKLDPDHAPTDAAQFQQQNADILERQNQLAVILAQQQAKNTVAAPPIAVKRAPVA